MKRVFTAILVLASASILADEPGPRPEAVVMARMDAYNAHDLERFLATYGEDIRIFTYPDVALGKPGKDHLAFIFKPLFEDGGVHVVIENQITQGNFVVNHETVSYGEEEQKYVSIYEVEDGLIRTVRFIRE